MKTLKYLLLLFAALAGACTTQAQYAQRVDVVQNAMGYAVPSASVTVCTYSAGQYSLVLGVWTYNGTLPCTSTVTVYADPGGANPITQPVVTNGNGDYTYWTTPGTYTECVAGYQIYTYCVAVTLGGAGGGPTLQTNGTPNTSQVLLNLAAGMNVTLTNVAGTTTINASGGCTLPGHDTAVVTEHPASTCYDSLDFTWDDGTGKKNLQAGNGTNTTGAVATLTNDFGASNNLCNSANPATCSIVVSAGSNNDIETAQANSGDVFTDVFNLGSHNALDGNLSHDYVIGGGATTFFGNSISTDNLSSITYSMCLLQGCADGETMVADLGAQLAYNILAGYGNFLDGNGASVAIQDVNLFGAFNSVRADDTSLLSSIFKYGESVDLRASGGSTIQDYYSLGSSSTGYGTALIRGTAASGTRYLVDVGFVNAFTSSGGKGLQRAFSIGDTISQTSSSASTLETYGFGDNLTLANCSHCFLFGENGSTTASNFIGIGLSATPELEIKSGEVDVTGIASGNCVQTSTNGKLVSAGGACGVSGGGSAFNALTSGNNTTATMTVGAGASLAPASTGTITANLITPAGTMGNCVEWGAAGALADTGSACGGAGVSSFSGDGALLSNSSSTGAVTDTLHTATAYKVWANCTSGTTTPSYCSLVNAMLPSTAVTPGSYTLGSFTVNQQGVITAASSGSSSGFANTALSNLSAVAINASLLPGTVNTVDLGSSPLPARNVYVGAIANRAAELDGSLLSANRLQKFPDEAGTFAMVGDATTCAQQPVEASGDVTNSSGSCAKTVAAIQTNPVTITSIQPYDFLQENAAGTAIVNTPGQQCENKQTGTTYTFVAADRGCIVMATNAGAQAYALPQAGTPGFTSKYYTSLANLPTTATPATGPVTVTAAAGSDFENLPGQPQTLVLNQNERGYIFSDDTNYFVFTVEEAPTFGSQAQAAYTGRTTAIGSSGSPITLLTTPASPTGAAYRISAPLSCDLSSAAATVTFSLKWTDPSGTAQSTTSSAATCTTLGASSFQSIANDINVMGGTAITYYTTIVSTPTYSLHVLLEGAW